MTAYADEDGAMALSGGQGEAAQAGIVGGLTGTESSTVPSLCTSRKTSHLTGGRSILVVIGDDSAGGRRDRVPVPREYGVTDYQYTVVDDTPVLVDPTTTEVEVRSVKSGGAFGSAGGVGQGRRRRLAAALSSGADAEISGGSVATMPRFAGDVARRNALGASAAQPLHPVVDEAVGSRLSVAPHQFGGAEPYVQLVNHANESKERAEQARLGCAEPYQPLRLNGNAEQRSALKPEADSAAGIVATLIIEEHTSASRKRQTPSFYRGISGMRC